MISYFANPERFMRMSQPVAIAFGALAAVLLAWAMYLVFFVAPATAPDADADSAFRIVYVHAPSAWLAVASYIALAGASFVYFIWRHSLADAAARAMAPLGAAFAILTFVTGWIWGSISWVSDSMRLSDITDPRLATMLVQILLFLGYIALRASIDDQSQSARAGAILALIGLVNIPLIRLSADEEQQERLARWLGLKLQPLTSLHQGPSVTKLKPEMEPEQLVPLLMCFAGFTALFVALALVRTRSAVLRRRAESIQRAMERAA